MFTVIASSLVSACALVTVAFLTFFLNEKSKRVAEWRAKKLEYYADFFDSLATNIEGYASKESHESFARETNNMNLVASEKVLVALHAYRDHIAVSNTNRDYGLDNRYLSELLNAMREDVKIPGGRISPDAVRLWSPGPRRPGALR